MGKLQKPITWVNLLLERKDMKINKFIDHTVLAQDADEKKIEKLLEEAKEHDFASVCVNFFSSEKFGFVSVVKTFQFDNGCKCLRSCRLPTRCHGYQKQGL